MKTIQLTNGRVAIVDDADFNAVSEHRWNYIQCKKVGYARTTSWRDGRLFTIYMHNLILPHPPKMHTDHISQDTLDNRRSNLRTCTHAQNLHNCGKRATNRSGYLGVFPYGKKWAFKSVTNGVKVTGKGFSTPKDAAMAYDAHVRAVRGEFAHTNFPL